jgi:hypothetical protein
MSKVPMKENSMATAASPSDLTNAISHPAFGGRLLAYRLLIVD